MVRWLQTEHNDSEQIGYILGFGSKHYNKRFVKLEWNSDVTHNGGDYYWINVKIFLDSGWTNFITYHYVSENKEKAMNNVKEFVNRCFT